MNRGAVAAILALVLAGCGDGGGGQEPDPRRPAAPRAAGGAVAEEHLGRGPTSAWVFRPQRPRGTVLFLHGWTAADPSFYRPWIDHLTRGRWTVVYPQYQEPPFVSPATAFGSMVAGVRRAVRRLGEDAGPWSVVGHSAGGALGAEYAAAARGLGLPVPRALLAAYPGRRFLGSRFGLPELVDLRGVPRSVRVLAVAGARDRTVGDVEARRIARLVPGAGLRVLGGRDGADHLAPQRARGQRFWRAFDALLSGSRPSQVPLAP